MCVCASSIRAVVNFWISCAEAHSANVGVLSRRGKMAEEDAGRSYRETGEMRIREHFATWLFEGRWSVG